MKEIVSENEKCPLVFQDLEKLWYKDEFSSDPKQFEQIKDIEIISKYKNRARLIFDKDLIDYEKYREKTRRSDHNWIRTVLSSGTISDKISANSILIHDSAVHNLKSLDMLISMVKINKKRECILAIDALTDLFINYLLPNRALKNFEEHPFIIVDKLNDQQSNKRLLLWYFESILKAKYQVFIRAVQAVFQDTIAATKVKLSNTIVELLLANKHEQEKFLLEILINKLGDPDYKIASKVVFHLKRLLTKRPQKMLDTLLEIERLIYRPNISEKAQYYGFCCMNQFTLTRHDQDIANRLLIIYFSFFKKYIKCKEIDSRMLSSILIGVNRAYKYAKMNHEEIDNNINTLFKIVHVTNFNVSIQALMLLNQVVESRDDMLNRYYNALYRKMFDLESKNTSKQSYFLNLLFSSISKDDALPRIRAFAKRLLQICFNQNVPFICGSLMLLSELMKTKPNLFQFDNINLKVDTTFAFNNNSAKSVADDDDEEERFVDVKNESSDEELVDKSSSKKEEKNGKRKKGSELKTSWMHKNNSIHKSHDSYDYTQRNPLYSGADKTMTFELLHFSKHYHPTVAFFANRLINGEKIEYGGNPMEDFSLMHFLDRFVYKNPKKEQDKGSKTKKSIFVSKSSFKTSNISKVPINSKEYLAIDYKDIPEDEKFFYDYYKKQSMKKLEIEDEASDAESISDTEFDKYLSKTETDGGLEDEDWTLDVADALSKNKKKSNKNKSSDDDDDDDDDDEDLDEDDEDELAEAMKDEDFGDDFELDDEESNNGDDIEEDNVFVDELEEVEEEEEKPKKKKNGKVKPKSDDMHNLFAAADEFSELINEAQKYEDKGVGFISNKDNANYKQLKWESARFNDRPNKLKNKNFKKASKKSSGVKGGNKPFKGKNNKSKKNFRFNKK